MSKKASIIWFSALFVLFLTVSMLILPIDDDWFFLRYFPSAAQWSAGPYRWLYDCTLLPRDYWRPFEDMFLFALARNPQAFPYVNHLLTVVCCFASALIARKIAVRLGAASGTSLAITTTMAVSATSMGAMLSIDSLTHVSATLWGFLSMWAFISLKGWKRIALWLAAGITAIFCKESGIVYLFAGVLLDMIADHSGKPLPRKLIDRRWAAITALIISGAYCLVYFYLQSLNAQPEQVADIASQQPHSLTTDLLTSGQSHRLTPATFIKNIFIIFIGALWPVDTTALYYPSATLLSVTAVLGVAGPLLLMSAWRRAESSRRSIFMQLIALTAAIGLPTLITRAGEISPFPTNLMIGIAISVLVADRRISGIRGHMLVAAFLAATFITDMHKLSIAIEGGRQAQEMACRIVALSPEAPDSVLWVGIDESAEDRAGAAFNRSAFRGFARGAAAIREYGYRYPRKLTKIIVPPGPKAREKVDSIAHNAAAGYDCVWITSGSSVEVLR